MRAPQLRSGPLPGPQARDFGHRVEVKVAPKRELTVDEILLSLQQADAIQGRVSRLRLLSNENYKGISALTKVGSKVSASYLGPGIGTVHAVVRTSIPAAFSERKLNDRETPPLPEGEFNSIIKALDDAISKAEEFELNREYLVVFRQFGAKLVMDQLMIVKLDKPAN